VSNLTDSYEDTEVMSFKYEEEPLEEEEEKVENVQKVYGN
jgi:hypothetical protein